MIDSDRTYAADYDMKGDARKLAEKSARDAERLKADGKGDESKEAAADDAMAAAAAQTGQT
jgi:hypothetical protein